jgi:hypothetical protein
VDEELRRIWLDDPFSLTVDVIELEGHPDSSFAASIVVTQQALDTTT